MGEKNHNLDSVKAHYAELASRYDDKANPACKRYYEALVTRVLAGRQRVLELGAGSSSLLSCLDAPFKVACDLSYAMLNAHAPESGVHRLVADGQVLPCTPNSLDAIYAINVLEHTPDAQAVVDCAAELLQPGGVFLALTPNGDAERLLDLLERLHLKLPEGPHQFRTFTDCAALAGDAFTTLEHKKCLAFPAGPPAWVNWIDGLSARPEGWGLFQYIVLERR